MDDAKNQADGTSSPLSALDQLQRERGVAWLNAKWVGTRMCPICQENSWSVTGAHELRGYNGGNLVIGGGASVMPVFGAVCTTCGYIHWFSALMAGFVVEETDAK